MYRTLQSYSLYIAAAAPLNSIIIYLLYEIGENGETEAQHVLIQNIIRCQDSSDKEDENMCLCLKLCRFHHVQEDCHSVYNNN